MTTARPALQSIDGGLARRDPPSPHAIAFARRLARARISAMMAASRESTDRIP